MSCDTISDGLSTRTLYIPGDQLDLGVAIVAAWLWGDIVCVCSDGGYTYIVVCVGGGVYSVMCVHAVRGYIYRYSVMHAVCGVYIQCDMCMHAACGGEGI